MTADYYALLKVRRDATQDEIKRAYRRLAREMHPDVNPDPETQERFKEITQAYDVLSDTEKRRMYDMGLEPLQKNSDNQPADDTGPDFDFLIKQARQRMHDEGPTRRDTSSAAGRERSCSDSFTRVNSSPAEQLHYAVIHDYAGAIDSLLSHGVVPARETLLLAVQDQRTKLAARLIKNGAAPTPEMLYIAFCQRHLEEMTDVLLGGGAAPDRRTMDYARQGQMSAERLHFTIVHGVRVAARILLAGGTVPARKTLEFAVESRNPDLVQLLIKNGAKPRSAMLHRAIRRGDWQIARTLLEAGAVPYRKTIRLLKNTQYGESLKWARNSAPRKFIFWRGQSRFGF